MNKTQIKKIKSHLNRMEKTGKVGTKKQWDEFLDTLLPHLRESNIESPSMKGNYSCIIMVDGSRLYSTLTPVEISNMIRKVLNDLTYVKSDPFIIIPYILGKENKEVGVIISNISHYESI